jgi:hypothetical protein
MITTFLPNTDDRVRIHTSKKVNQKIDEKTIENIVNYSGASKEDIEKRLYELNTEWDIERVLEANAATVMLASSLLGLTVNKKWFFLSGAAAGFLLEHSVQGWCPPVPIFRRLGIRTAKEIDTERNALKAVLEKLH